MSTMTVSLQPKTLDEWKAVPTVEGLGSDKVVRDYLMKQITESCKAFGIEGKSVIISTGVGRILMTRKNDLIFIEWIPMTDGSKAEQLQKMTFWEFEDNKLVVEIGQYFRKHPDLRQPFEKIMGEV